MQHDKNVLAFGKEFKSKLKISQDEEGTSKEKRNLLLNPQKGISTKLYQMQNFEEKKMTF